MAFRRIKSTLSDSDVQPLKLQAGRNLVVNIGNPDAQIVYKKQHKYPLYSVILGAQYRYDTEALSLIAHIARNDFQIIHGGSCTFTVYSIDQTTWAPTLIGSYAGVVNSSGQFIKDITEVSLGFELDGEPVLMVTAEITKHFSTYRVRKYVNHIGIFDTVERLRRRVNTHEILQTDSQESIIHHIS